MLSKFIPEVLLAGSVEFVGFLPTSPLCLCLSLSLSLSLSLPFSLSLSRFSTATGLILSDQFLQLTALLPSANIYGLGEHAMDNFKLLTNNSVLTLFSRDQFPNPDVSSHKMVNLSSGERVFGVHVRSGVFTLRGGTESLVCSNSD